MNKNNLEDKVEALETRITELYDLVLNMSDQIRDIKTDTTEKEANEKLWNRIYDLLKYLDSKSIQLPLYEEGKPTPFKEAWDVMAWATLYLSKTGESEVTSEEDLEEVRNRARMKEEDFDKYWDRISEANKS